MELNQELRHKLLQFFRLGHNPKYKDDTKQSIVYHWNANLPFL